MVAYKLKERTKHHGYQDGQLVKLNPGAIVKTINPNFKDKFDLIDDVPENRMVKLDRPVHDEPTKHIIKDAVGQKVLEEEKPEEPPVKGWDDEDTKPKHEPLVVKPGPVEVELSSDEDEEDDDSETRVLKAVKKRGTKYIVVDQDGDKIHTGYMNKEKAERMAAEG